MLELLTAGTPPIILLTLLEGSLKPLGTTWRLRGVLSDRSTLYTGLNVEYPHLLEHSYHNNYDKKNDS